MTDWLLTLREGAAQLGLTLTDEQEDRFARFLTLLLERNAQINLTAITAPNDVAVKHFVDSLSVELLWRPKKNMRVIDIGTGAGFPGIPLAIRYPEVQIVLNDSVRKKVAFLSDAIRALELPNASAEWARAEELAKRGLRNRFDTAFARAVAHLGALIEYALPLLHNGGTLIAMKGPSGVREIEEARPALEAIGGVVSSTRALTLPDGGERLLIQVTKVHSTPQQFPRDPGQAKKKPLFLDSTRRTP